MTTQATPAAAPSGSDIAEELFALTDEQILDIGPEGDVSTPVGQPFLAVQERTGEAAIPSDKQSHGPENPELISTGNRHSAKTAQPEVAVPQWLAAQMNDPWSGEDAKEFWHGVQQTKSEAQAYRAAIATPEDARALKELYPGGIAEARAASERARMLDQIDRAYFGGEGNSPEQRSAARAQLAQQLLREDPAAFREMLAAGLEALQQAEQGIAAPGETASAQPRLAKVAAPQDLNVAQPFRAASSTETTAQTNRLDTNPDATSTPHQSRVTSHESLSAYAAFERAANDDLERSVGAAIDRALTQALPVAQALMPALRNEGPEQRKGQATNDPAPARSSPLRERLSAGIRAEVEKSLQGDRQLAEQVAQILSARRFDTDTRAQVVRLIHDRAQQLVPTAAKRVLNDWTQTTLAAHRARTQRGNAAADVAPASGSGQSLDWSDRSKDRPLQPATVSRASATISPRRVDYRKLTDEQILNL